MIPHSLLRTIISLGVILFGVRVANAACLISGARPTQPLPTTAVGQQFSFIATADCETLRFRVPGSTLTKIPRAGPDTGSRHATYKVALSESEWSSLVDESDTTFTWAITGTTRTGGTTRATMTNQLDSDRDGWTRTEGDVGECDLARGRNPGVAELCDGVDQDCDGLVDEEGPSWFRDADGDGHGDDGDTRCTWAEGYVDVGGDCDDGNPRLWCTTLELPAGGATLVGEASGDQAGMSTSGAGDVNGDGRDDLLVGAYLNDDGGADAGAVYLVLGPVTGRFALSSADAKFVGEAAYSGAGASLDAGDVDGDGRNDMIISGGTGDGRSAAYVVSGPLTGTVNLSSADAKLVTEPGTGCSVSTAGDVNGDGHGDVLVGAPGDPFNDPGIAYLVLGPVTGSRDLASADATYVGRDGGAGYSVASTGDTDGDGNMDIVIGAPYLGDGRENGWRGAAYVAMGPISGSHDVSAADATLHGEGSQNMAGLSVSGAGDVDGDGHDDVFVGAPYNDLGGEYSGSAYLFLGPVRGNRALANADARLVGESAFTYAGWPVSGAGDVDADGYDDLLVGANWCCGTGAAYVLRGPISGTLSLAFADDRLIGASTWEDAGYGSSGAGDVDADGRDDVLVGAPFADDSSAGTNVGAAYLVYGAGL